MNLLQESLVKKGILVDAKDKFYQKIMGKTLRLPSSPLLILKFSEIRLNILATSLGIPITPQLMGHMEVKNE